MLLNEGIAATSPFISEASENEDFVRVTGSHKQDLVRYVVCEVDDDSGCVTMGVRQLGSARLKGLGEVVVYEVVDADRWSTTAFAPPAAPRLLEALDLQYSASPRSPEPKPPPFEAL